MYATLSASWTEAQSSSLLETFFLRWAAQVWVQVSPGPKSVLEVQSCATSQTLWNSRS